MDNSTMNETVSRAPRPRLTESELILAYARELYGQYYEIIFPITLVICVLGFITNVFNVTVFTRKHMNTSLNFLLAALSIFDILMIFSQFPYTVHYVFGFQFQFTYGWTQTYIILVFLELLGAMVTNWLAVIIGIWRNLAIRWPLKYNRWCDLKRARIILAILIVLGLALSLPVFALLKIKEHDLYDKSLYTKGFTEFAIKNGGQNLRIFWGGLLVVTFIPCVTLILVNTLLIINFCGYSRNQNSPISIDKPGEEHKLDRRSHRITLMITVILVLYVVNNLPDSALVLAAFFDSGNEETKKKIRHATDVLRIFSLLNNSLSFFIYYFLGERRFKRTFCSIFCSRWSKRTYSPGKMRSSSETISTESLNEPRPGTNAQAEEPL